MADSSSLLPRYDPFTIKSVVYKTVGSHPIQASILIPHGLKLTKCPLMVRFHGGGFVEGVRLGDWFRTWLLDFCAREGVILVSPDYRFIPESTGYDMMEDVRDFWMWVKMHLKDEVINILPIDIDLDRIAVTGESAGGYLAVQSFCGPNILPQGLTIRVVPIQAPLLDLTHASQPANRRIFDLPEYPADISKKYLTESPRGTVLTSWEPSGRRSELAWSMLQHGTLVDALEGTLDGDERGKKRSNIERSLLRPIENLVRLKESPPNKFPAIWIVHAWQDCVVPVEGTWNFLAQYKKLFPDVPVLLDLLDGDHGFDGEWPSDSPQVERGLEWTKKHWFD
ncbi:alpha/beta-hydrolase [Rhizodiscina lignyota]|uniref:Alpha/beta-hydrolase n=1 Tax=Rhizodiscina lignyota TaxID=1504668 RepID=A0A9P4I5A7_9PEZI|nr:alpha/beta-hydrolase [Rhizodiscina lignyota]